MAWNECVEAPALYKLSNHSHKLNIAPVLGSNDVLFLLSFLCFLLGFWGFILSSLIACIVVHFFSVRPVRLLGDVLLLRFLVSIDDMLLFICAHRSPFPFYPRFFIPIACACPLFVFAGEHHDLYCQIYLR